jgi:predicted transcriptional regulator of viral defense system
VVNVAAQSLAGKLTALFRDNGGVATVEQLAAAGLSAERLRRLTRRGVLVPARRGVYVAGTLAERMAHDPANAEALRVAGVVAVTNGGWIASHQSAAVMHGLDLLGPPPTKVVTVTQPHRGAGNRSGYAGVRIRAAEVPDEHVTRRFKVPCTTVPRTVIDLARSQTFTAGVVVADNALHANKTTRAELEGVLARCNRWPGIVNARRVVEFSDERSESVLESVARVVMHEHGLEPPELQVWVGGDGVRIGRVDFLWPKHRTVAEADGKGKYDDRSQAMRQLERDARLRDAGFEVVHFTWAEIVYAPEQVIARIYAAFRRAERLGRYT